MPTPTPHDAFRAYMSAHGHKSSRQRDVIVDVFLAADGHLSIDELLERVRRKDSGIGQATVYRTMKLLQKSGLAEARQFGDGHTRYERKNDADEHHDHLICTSCKRIIEFQNHDIEALQERVARSHGFVVMHHKLELYGLCPDCQRRRPR